MDAERVQRAFAPFVLSCLAAGQVWTLIAAGKCLGGRRQEPFSRNLAGACLLGAGPSSSIINLIHIHFHLQLSSSFLILSLSLSFSNDNHQILLDFLSLSRLLIDFELFKSQVLSNLATTSLSLSSPPTATNHPTSSGSSRGSTPSNHKQSRQQPPPPPPQLIN